MKEVDVKLKELKELMSKEDKQSEARRMEIALWIKENKTEEVEKAFRAFMNEGLTEIEIEIEDIRRQTSTISLYSQTLLWKKPRMAFTENKWYKSERTGVHAQ